MNDDARDFLTHLWRGGSWAYWWTPDGPPWFNPKTQQEEPGKLSLWFPVATPAPIPAWWADKNVHFGVHPVATIPEVVSEKTGRRIPQQFLRSSIRDIAAVNCVFADFDAKAFEGGKDEILAKIDGLPLFPTMVIDSGGGFHAYWLFEYTQAVTDENREDFRRLQYAWVNLVGGDGGAKDLSRILRVPGYQNRKKEYDPDFPTVRIFEFDVRRIFPFESIAAIAADLVHALAAAETREREEKQATIPASSWAQLLHWALTDPLTTSRHNTAVDLAFRLRDAGAPKSIAGDIVQRFVTERIDDRQTDGEAENAVNYAYR